MKLNTYHLFLIVLAFIAFSYFGYGVKEYFENQSDVNTTKVQASNHSALPKGIPKSEIPNGDEDLYIKKSEVVPPVCPKCPDVVACPKQEKCPPCPACERCPEPAYACKLVPNYDAVGDDRLPRPVLTDFSQFGM